MAEQQNAEQKPATSEPTTQAAPQQSAAPTKTVVDVSQIPDEALKDRLDRHARSILSSSLGVKTPEEAKAMREKLTTLEKQEEERKLAAVTEQEKLTKLLEGERQQREALAFELEKERETNKLMQVANAKGVKNLEYAQFLVDRAKRDGQAVDIDRVVSDALGDPLTRAALGIVDEKTPAPPTPANTSPQNNPAPKPPTAGGGTGGPKSAKEMTAQEWQAYKRGVGMI